MLKALTLAGIANPAARFFPSFPFPAARVGLAPLCFHVTSVGLPEQSITLGFGIDKPFAALSGQLTGSASVLPAVRAGRVIRQDISGNCLAVAS